MKGYGENSQPAATSDEYRKGYDNIFGKKEEVVIEDLECRNPVCATKMLICLSEISQMCIGEIAMGYKLDSQCIGEMIFEATGMTSTKLLDYSRAPINCCSCNVSS